MTPYKAGAPLYLHAGWAGVIPLPPKKKKSPPTGYTGWNGKDPSPKMIETWCNETVGDFQAASNIAIHMPDGVVGIDVDHYNGKTGGATLAQLEQDLGPLPPTYISTSRNGGVSGIRWYRVEPGLRWPTGPGKDIEFIHKGHRYAVVWPSIHPHTAAEYVWVDHFGRESQLPNEDELAWMPDEWQLRFTNGEARTGQPEFGKATDDERARCLTDGAMCMAVTKALNKFEDRLTVQARHDSALKTVMALCRLGEQGHKGVNSAIAELKDRFVNLVSRDRADGSEGPEFQRMVDGGVVKVLAGPTAAEDKRCCGSDQAESHANDWEGLLYEPGAERDIKAALDALIADLRTWQDLPDPTHVIVAIAVAATRKAGGESCWLLLVAPPSSGKTEAVRILDLIADGHLNEVTAAGLLGWSKGNPAKPTGVLARIGDKALVTFGDLSSLLATSDGGGRDQVFSLLRRAYDGHVTRDISPPGRVNREQTQLRWSGRLTIVACVTGIIDRYSAHADQLGPRWIYTRIAERDTKAKRTAAKQARRKGLDGHRKRSREAVAALLARVSEELPELPDAVWDAIEDAALVTAWGRGAVPRNGYGRRDIEGVPVIEEPMRLVQQFGILARGVLALGLPEQAAVAIARRVAVDSMPEARRAVLDALSLAHADGQMLNTAGCARAASLDRKVARMALEELAAIGVVFNDREHEDSDDHQGVIRWALSGEDGELIAQVFNEFRAGQGWDEIMS